MIMCTTEKAQVTKSRIEYYLSGIEVIFQIPSGAIAC